MKFSTISNFGASLMALATNVAAFDAAGSNNVVLYWGQASAGSQEPLGTYCESNAADVYVVSFLNSFNGNGDLTLTISGCNDNFAGGLANCPAIAADIKKCQSLGKKVFISLGGAVGSYGFTSDAGGANFADTLWNTFGGGTAAERPFGDAIVDGYDLDIENQQQMGYVALVKRLREHFASSSGQYYISATPQCPYPDASVGEALAGADIDFAYVQFYNNYCGVNNPGQFNFDTWDNFAKTVSPNKNIKIYLGVPGAVSAASTGYIDGATLKSYVDKVKQYSSFGGIMMWDASQAFKNTEGGVSYAEIAKNALGGGGAPVVASAPVVAASSPAAPVAPVATSSAAAPAWSPVSSPVAEWSPEPAVSSPAAPAPVESSHTYDNGQWKNPETVASLPVASAPILAAEDGEVGQAESTTTVTENETVTSTGSTETTTVPVAAETSVPVDVAAETSVPVDVAAGETSSIPSPSSSKSKHTVYHTTVESVYIDTTVVSVPGPSPTEAAAAESAPAEGVSSVASLPAVSNPAFAAESGEVKNKVEGESGEAASSDEVTTTTTSSIYTTRTILGKSEGAAETTEVAAAESSATEVASSVETSSSAPVTSSPATSEAAAAETSSSTSSSSSASPVTSPAVVPASDLLSQVTTVTTSAATISLADSAPQKTISPESAHPPCDGKEGDNLADCLNGIFGNPEVISKLSIVEKKAVETAVGEKTADAPAATSAPTPQSENKVAEKTEDKPVEADKSEKAADKPADTSSKDTSKDSSKDTPSSKDSSKDTPSSKDIPSTATPLAEFGCTEGQVGCSPTGEFIMCNFNKWVHFACPPTTTCFAFAVGKNAVVGCNYIDAPVPLLKRADSPVSHRSPPTLQQRRQNNVDVFAMLK
ncbi:Endochitinase [Yarrowia sp. C11]|nr:Endochitinase [Yarrowia sp. C11]